MSDTHGDENTLRWLLEQLWKTSGKIDVYLHLGDGVNDFWQVERFIGSHDPSAAILVLS